MGGFTRRYASFPGADVISSIEGVVIVDNPAPGAVAGTPTGVVALIGEFADCHLGVVVDPATGLITTQPQPVQITSGQDQLNQLGGFDATLGDWANSCGNGFASLRGKQFAALVCVPINLASSHGARIWRQLPTNKSAIDASPIVPTSAAQVPAAYEFRVAPNRVRTAQLVTFAGLEAYQTGVDAAVLAVAGAATPASITSSVGPFALFPAETLIVAFNAGGSQTFTVLGVKGFVQGAAATFAALNGTTVKFALNGGATQTITFDSSAVDAATTAAFIDANLTGGSASVVGGQVKVFSGQFGTGSSVNVISTNAAAGFAAAGLGTAGTGSAANLAAMTAAELATLLGAITNGTATAVGGALVLTSTTTGTGGTVQVSASSTVTGYLGFDNAVHTGAAAGSGTQTVGTVSIPSGGLTNSQVTKGDAFVLGVIGGAGALGGNAATYRVVGVASDTSITVETADGSAFNWVTGSALPYRFHVAQVFDSTGQGSVITDAAQTGYVLPMRPLDATIGASSALAPSVTPPAATATAWDPLSGLTGGNIASLVYTAAVQGVNPPSSASFDALYQSCLDALLGDADPARSVNIVVTARTSATIRAATKAHVGLASQQGIGRTAPISPALSVSSLTTVLGSLGVQATRAERLDYNWPGFVYSLPEAVGISIPRTDGRATLDGLVEGLLSIQLASVLSVLPPENNPGQLAEPVPTAMANVLAFQRSVAGLNLGINDYTLLKQGGVCALRFDRDAGPIFQSGVTSSLTPGQTNINRRRMADFIQDSLTTAYQPFSKSPLTQELKDTLFAETDNFLSGLLSANNPTAQRIVAYQIDNKSGNTPDLEARGIYVLIVKVRTLATLLDVVLSSQIGEGVVIFQQTA